MTHKSDGVWNWDPSKGVKAGWKRGEKSQSWCQRSFSITFLESHVKLYNHDWIWDRKFQELVDKRERSRSRWRLYRVLLSRSTWLFLLSWNPFFPCRGSEVYGQKMSEMQAGSLSPDTLFVNVWTFHEFVFCNKTLKSLYGCVHLPNYFFHSTQCLTANNSPFVDQLLSPFMLIVWKNTLAFLLGESV